MRFGHPRVREGLLVAAAALALAGCGGPTLEEQAASALNRQGDQRPRTKEEAGEPVLPLDRQDNSAAHRSTAAQEKPRSYSARRNVESPSSSGKTPNLRIGDAKVHVDRRKMKDGKK
jgi:hypothetical protein